MVNYQFVICASNGIFGLWFGSLLAICGEIQQRVLFGTYSYPISKHQRDNTRPPDQRDS